jgi:hydrogenase-4 component B
MRLLLLAVGVQLLGGVGAGISRRSRQWSTTLGVGGAVLGALLGLVATAGVLLGAPPQALWLRWDVPFAAFAVEVDALSAFFLLPVLGLSALTAVYGGEYLLADEERRSPGASWFFFNLLIASIVLVLVARNAVLFLVAWEVMALASFFLVTADDEDAAVREAGWTYLVATHLGTACLLVMFVVLGRGADPLDFDRFSGASNAGLVFLLAVVGFGTKAGFVPFHVWLPEAHPAAPSHVSAVMSGVMIKTGIYGLVRVLTMLGPPAPWWGWTLCGIGMVSGVGGVLFALAQHDLKRLLAYHSVENIGIIALGLGLGVLGRSIGAPALAVLGFGGALLHVVNHAIFKGLLFLGAGAVAQATGTRDLDHLGGLLGRMPGTGLAFLVGAIAISGLPPLNGFVSELLIYLGAYHALVARSATTTLPALGVIGALALIGGLAAACFTKAFGVVFLGTARSSHATHASEPGPAMRWPMYGLAAACVLIGLLAPLVVRSLAPVLVVVTQLPSDVVRADVASATAVFARVTTAAIGLLAIAAALAAVRRTLLTSRDVREAGTWDCGYAAPTARMQYTASSFAQPLTRLFDGVLHTERRLVAPHGFFPREAALATETLDVARERLYAPVFGGIGRVLGSLRWLQHGRVHLYVLYVAATLLVLLLWKLG